MPDGPHHGPEGGPVRTAADATAPSSSARPADPGTAIAGAPTSLCPTAAADAKAALDRRRGNVYELRIAGYRWRAIAKALGIPKTTAMRDYERELQEITGDQKNRKPTMLAQLQHAKKSLWARVSAGDVRANEVLVKILDREAKLAGSDAPHKYAVAVGTWPGDEREPVPLLEHDRWARTTLTPDEQARYDRLIRIPLDPHDPLRTLKTFAVEDLKLLHRVAKRRLLGPPRLRYADIATYDQRLAEIAQRIANGAVGHTLLSEQHRLLEERDELLRQRTEAADLAAKVAAELAPMPAADGVVIDEDTDDKQQVH